MFSFVGLNTVFSLCLHTENKEDSVKENTFVLVNTKRTFPVADQRLHAGVKFPQLNVQILKMLLLLLKPLTQTQTHPAIKTVFIYPVFPSDFHSLLLSFLLYFPFLVTFTSASISNSLLIQLFLSLLI